MELDILLVHGLGRTPLSLNRLAGALRREGHDVHQVGYLAAVESTERIVSRIRDRIEQSSNDGRPLVAVGHSLGGVLVRAALARPGSAPVKIDHLIMLGPPNQSPRLARRLHRTWPYRLVNGEVGQQLAEPSFVESLPLPDYPCTIVAGTGGPTGKFSPFGSAPNDTVVAVDETRLVPGAPVITLPTRHTFMMNDRRVRAVIMEIVGRCAAVD